MVTEDCFVTSADAEEADHELFPVPIANLGLFLTQEAAQKKADKMNKENKNNEVTEEERYQVRLVLMK